MRAGPVAQGGKEAKMGEKKRERMKNKPVVRDVRPVLPPSVMPAPDSIKAVTGETPRRAPMEMEVASVRKAAVEEWKSPVGRRKPAN